MCSAMFRALIRTPQYVHMRENLIRETVEKLDATNLCPEFKNEVHVFFEEFTSWTYKTHNDTFQKKENVGEEQVTC
jgi:hypothetical protein